MELIERYLQAVKFWLPKKQQDDIIAELSEDLRAQLEEREAELARHLTEPEIEDLLRRRGSPARVALGYLPQRSLIGPVLFPIYIFVLKIVTLVSFLLPLAVGLIAGMISRAAGHMPGTGWTPPFAALIKSDWNSWLGGMATVTLVFAIIERMSAKEKLFANWNPRKLPPLRSAHTIPRFNSIFAISGLACLLIFWVLEMAPPLALRLGNFHIVMTPEWTFVFWAVLTLSSSTFVLEIINLLRPWWTMQRAGARLILDLGGFAVFCWSMQAHFVARAFWPGATTDKTAFVAAALNVWLARVFPWAAAVKFIVVLFDVRRLLRVRNRDMQTGWNPA